MAQKKSKTERGRELKITVRKVVAIIWDPWLLEIEEFGSVTQL